MRRPSKSIRKRKKFLKKIILDPKQRQFTLLGLLMKNKLNEATHLVLNPESFYRDVVRGLKKQNK